MRAVGLWSRTVLSQHSSLRGIGGEGGVRASWSSQAPCPCGPPGEGHVMSLPCGPMGSSGRRATCVSVTEGSRALLFHRFRHLQGTLTGPALTA